MSCRCIETSQIYISRNKYGVADGAYVELTGNPRIGDLNPSMLYFVHFLLRLPWVPVGAFFSS